MLEDNNSFPIDVLPQIFKEIVIDLHKSLNYPIDYSATAILTAISTAIGTSVKVRVKANWFEYASFYCCLIGNAGASKTHPINFAFEPLKIIDKVNHDFFVEQLKKFTEYEKLTKKEKLTAKKVEEPKLKKHILTNFTPEALNKRLNENLRGCCIVSDEMATFFEGMNNYSKGDQISIYLTIWSNQSTTIDRIGDPIPLFIKNPFLSIIGGIQPRMLSHAFPLQKLNNGFYQRFLFAFPDTVLKQAINDNEINDFIINRYGEFLKNLIEKKSIVETNGIINSKTLNWTTEAKVIFYEWQKENCHQVNEYLDSVKGEILSKYDNHFIRLALLLQIMENSESDFIEIKAVEGAKKLCNYYINCSFKVLAVIQNPINYLSTLAENKRNLHDNLKLEFTTAEAVELGNKFDLQERRTKDFLNDTILFKRLKHGFYRKNLKSKL